MKMKDIRIDEVDKVIDMYQEVRKYNKNLTSIKEFCEQYLERCQCCGEIFYYDSLCECEDMYGHKINCCRECSIIIENDKPTHNINDWDTIDSLYEDRKLGIV